jgi:hypothetical protein
MSVQRCNVCGRLANAPHTVWAYGIIVEQCSDPCHRQYVQGCILDYSAAPGGIPTTVRDTIRPAKRWDIGPNL